MSMKKEVVLHFVELIRSVILKVTVVGLTVNMIQCVNHSLTLSLNLDLDSLRYRVLMRKFKNRGT